LDFSAFKSSSSLGRAKESVYPEDHKYKEGKDRKTKRSDRQEERVLLNDYESRTTDQIFFNINTAPGTDTLAIAKAAILEEIQVTPEEITRLHRLCQRLPDGSCNPEWLAARRWRLTASKFSVVRKAGIHPQIAEDMLEDWWYRGEGQMDQKIKRALAFEDKSLEKLKYRLGPAGPTDGLRRVEQIGVLVAKDFPWLAASPDGLVVSEDGRPLRLVEVKSFDMVLHAKSPGWHQAMAIASSAFGVPIHSTSFITPTETYNVRFDAAWWGRYSKKLQAFYFDEFLPRAANKLIDLGSKKNSELPIASSPGISEDSPG
ncbi:unnamed protein product, partial [Polarella glacialis]